MIRKINADIAQLNQAPNPAALFCQEAALQPYAQNWAQLKKTLLENPEPLVIAAVNPVESELLDVLEDVQQKSSHIFVIRGSVG